MSTAIMGSETERREHAEFNAWKADLESRRGWGWQRVGNTVEWAYTEFATGPYRVRAGRMTWPFAGMKTNDYFKVPSEFASVAALWASRKQSRGKFIRKKRVDGVWSVRRQS